MQKSPGGAAGARHLLTHCITVSDESREPRLRAQVQPDEAIALLHPCGSSPADVIGGADTHLAPLQDRLWAAATDQDLLDGIAALEAHQARLGALRVRMLAEITARDLPRTQLRWASNGDWYAHLAGTDPFGRTPHRRPRQSARQRTRGHPGRHDCRPRLPDPGRHRRRCDRQAPHQPHPARPSRSRTAGPGPHPRRHPARRSRTTDPHPRRPRPRAPQGRSSPGPRGTRSPPRPPPLHHRRRRRRRPRPRPRHPRGRRHPPRRTATPDQARPRQPTAGQRRDSESGRPTRPRGPHVGRTGRSGPTLPQHRGPTRVPRRAPQGRSVHRPRVPPRRRRAVPGSRRSPTTGSASPTPPYAAWPATPTSSPSA